MPAISSSNPPNSGWSFSRRRQVSLEPEQRNEASVEYVGERVSCLLNTTAAVLDAIQQTDALGLAGSLTNLAYSFESCSGEAEGEIKEPQQCPLCFAAGTPVHTDHGDVPVQDIKVGDEVLSANSKTGKTEYQPVTALTHPHLDQLLEVRIEGEAEPLRPSTGHPFWVRSAESDAGHWVAAGHLRVGDFLETPAGGWRRVVSVQVLAGEQTVYNFTVAKDHDYFVGETGFLVHNAMPCGCKFPDNPADMNDILGFPGEDVPDLLDTPGRNKTIWNLAQGVQLRFEAHPYFPPGLDPGEYIPHWQLKYPKAPKPHPKWFPGDKIPGCK